jgi:hypothetical protein
MKLSSFILPQTSNNGESLLDIHSTLRAQLCDTFGGFTATETQGGWRDSLGKVYVDRGWRYEVCLAPADSAKLDSIARFYGHMAGQLSVYVCHDGEPAILELHVSYDAETAQKTLEIA